MLSLSLFDDPHLAVDGRRSSLGRKEIGLVSYLALQGAGSAAPGLSGLCSRVRSAAGAPHLFGCSIIDDVRCCGDDTSKTS